MVQGKVDTLSLCDASGLTEDLYFKHVLEKLVSSWKTLIFYKVSAGSSCFSGFPLRIESQDGNSLLKNFQGSSSQMITRKDIYLECSWCSVVNVSGLKALSFSFLFLSFFQKKTNAPLKMISH